VRVGGLLSFQFIFQCKRIETLYSVAVRDFRGAMVGRADKAANHNRCVLRDARAEAARRGSTLDLVDGETRSETERSRLGVHVAQHGRGDNGG